MADTVTFVAPSSAGANAVINGPPFVGQPVRSFPNYVIGQAADGSRYVYHMSNVTLWTIGLGFINLTLAMKQKLQAFYDDEVTGPVSTFSYIDTNGTTHGTCRFLNTMLEWTRENNSLWAVSVTLESPNDFE